MLSAPAEPTFMEEPMVIGSPNQSVKQKLLVDNVPTSGTVPKTIVRPIRPGFGSSGKAIRLLANMYGVTFDPLVTICHYGSFFFSLTFS